MYKLPGIKPRPSTSGQRNTLKKATSRKRIKKATNGKDSIVRSRIIFNQQMVDHKENKKINHPTNVLFSLKNLNLTSKNNNTKIVNSLYCNEEPAWLDKNNKSFDDASKLAKQRHKIRKACSIAKNQIILNDSKPKYTSEFRLNKLLKKESQNHCSSPLTNHNIKEKLRSRMIDWMVECFAIYKKKSESFFLATYIFDHYLQKTDSIYDDSHVHLLGICCIFIATKYSDIMPISLFDMCEKIGHGTFGPNLIRKDEYEILKTLNWDVNLITPFHFTSFFIQSMKAMKIGSDCDSEMTLVDSIDERTRTITISVTEQDPDSLKEIFDTLELCATQFSKMCIINEGFISYKPSEISLASLINGINYIKDTGYSCHKSELKPCIHNTQSACRNCQSYSFNFSLQEHENLERVSKLLDEVLSKNNFDKIKLSKLAEDMRQWMNTFEENYSECRNIFKFSLIEN